MKKPLTKIRPFVVAAVFFLSVVPVVNAVGLESYVGLLRHEKTKRDQVVKLDLILSRSQENKLEYSGVLTLHFGDLRSREYVAYHFHKVHYYLFDQSFTFDQADQGVTIRRARLEGDTLTGELRSEFSGNVGKLILTRKGTVSPEYPLIEPVWGEYSGKCDPFKKGAYKTTVQLYTYRSTEDTSRVGHPFAPYAVKGLIGQDKGDTCMGDEGSRMCIWGRIYGSSYNFFKNRLDLFGKNKNLNCTTTPKGLNCNDCALERISKETVGTRVLRPSKPSPYFFDQLEEEAPALADPPSSVEGEYLGYLHHEYLDVYQPVTLNILTYPVSEGAGQVLKMSAIATISFGDFESPESIVYRFRTRDFPNPLLLGQFVFENAEADTDAILQIKKIAKGTVSGTWYSQRFGRVGRFLLRKDAAPTIPENARLISPVSGRYADGQWDLDVSIGLGSTPRSTENPFFPLIFSGRAIFIPLGGPARTILGGSYDFYTGRIAIDAEHPRWERVFIGERSAGGKFKLKTFFSSLLTSLPSHNLNSFPQLERREP